MFAPQEPERYLYKDFYGDYTKYGVPFIDGSTDVEHSRNLLIHGHNARSGILFGDLDKFLNRAFFDKHRYIRFDTLYEERVYEIVAVCKTSVDADSFRYFEYVNIWDEEIANAYLNQAVSNSSLAVEGDSVAGSSLITLSTCSRHVKQGRLVIVGWRVSYPI